MAQNYVSAVVELNENVLTRACFEASASQRREFLAGDWLLFDDSRCKLEQIVARGWYD
ncbi:MAG TPA: hypothetical protein VLA49_07605 [Anaerolineales bacterium]|nr:hypothetical protein [Anaerolineales bacterium]